MKKTLALSGLVMGIVLGSFSIAAAYTLGTDNVVINDVGNNGYMYLAPNSNISGNTMTWSGTYFVDLCVSATAPYDLSCSRYLSAQTQVDLAVLAPTIGYDGVFLAVGTANATSSYIAFRVSGGLLSFIYGPENIDWNSLSVAPPLDFNAVKFVATSTSFFSGTTSSSTLEAISLECSQSGNIFAAALCRAFAYLWIPNPTVLNQYSQIGPALATKFPLSWFYQVQTAVNTVSTTTLSSPIWTMNFHDIGIGSTTPMGNVLPNLVVFSSSTVKQYITETQWTALMTLAGAAIWLLAFYTLYGIGHRLFTGHKNTV